MKHALFLFASFAFAQSPTFEVASVKPASADSPASRIPAVLPPAVQEQMRMSGGPGTKDPGRISYSGVTLKMLIKRAYEMDAEQIAGPAWLDSERYDIVATLPRGTTSEEFRLMLQNLLADRFELRQHRESRILPIYVLTVAKNGPKLQAAESPPEYKDDDAREAALRKQGSQNLAAMMAARQRGEPVFGRSFHVSNGSMAKLIQMIAPNLDRPVKDKTQIEGAYSFSLKWTPEGQTNTGDGAPGPSIYAALEEQLGLKLQPAKGDVEFLVIDHAAKIPIAN